MLLLMPLALAAEPTSGTVASVYDGDSLTLASGGRIQLRGVRAPDSSAPYGIEARELTRSLVGDQEVLLSYRTEVKNPDGTLTASVRAMEGDLAQTLLEQGYAWLSIQAPDSLDLTMMVTAQNAAKAAGRGIWSTERFSGALHISDFVANAEGDDRENINGEYLRLCNTDARPVDLHGYTLRDRSGNIWNLPPLVVPIGHTVLVHSGTGINQTDPSQPLAVYLNSDRPIWNNTEDQATLTDRAGRVVDAVKQHR